MATPRKEKVRKNSTTKPKANRARKPAVRMTETECACCPDCAEKPSWTMGTCEDGTCKDIPPPSYVGVLTFDPSMSPQTGQYWERLKNFPIAEIKELFDVMIANMDSMQISNLVLKVTSMLGGTEKAALALAIVGNLQCSVTCSCGGNPCMCSAVVSSI